ncbi:hypothetical protein CLOM_g12913 [Closterium sp. NIES-68]|nr:hypothetical protein CLOM_g12913 [Closterium sp. NIES-68]GJP83170.1 hypothetical protein CLOP_g13363 [Closterium sp. NIES-67]
MLSHKQAMQSLRNMHPLENSQNLVSCAKHGKLEQPERPEKLESLQNPEGLENTLCSGRRNLGVAGDGSGEGDSDGARDCSETCEISQKSLARGCSEIRDCDGDGDGATTGSWVTDAERRAILDHEEAVGKALVKVDEELQQLHKMLKSLTCMCNKASSAVSSKWLEEGHENVGGGGGGGIGGAIAAAAFGGSGANKQELQQKCFEPTQNTAGGGGIGGDVAAVAFAQSTDKQVLQEKGQSLLVEDAVTRMQQKQRQQREEVGKFQEGMKTIEGDITLTLTGNITHQQQELNWQQKQEQQEGMATAAEMSQLRERLGRLCGEKVLLEAELNKQRIRMDENEKATAHIMLLSFPLALQNECLDFTPYPTISDRDISLVIRALSILHPSLLPSIAKLVFGRDGATSACKAITGSFLLPGAGVLQFDSLTENPKELHLASCTGITDDSLCHVSSFHSLQRLNLILCTGLSGTVLAHLSKCPSLKVLYISHTRIREEGLSHLSTVTTLQELQLQGCSISSIGLHHLGRIKSLEILSLGGCVGCMVCHDISASLLHLTHLRSLKELWLWGCDTVTSAAATSTAATSAAVTLAAAKGSSSKPRITGSSRVSHVNGPPTPSPALSPSVAAASPVAATAPAASATAGLSVSLSPRASHKATSPNQPAAAPSSPSASSLPSVKPACVKLTNKGLSLLSYITTLRRLHLKGCPAVTDDGFAVIAGLRLVLLEADACHAISDKGIEKLSRYKPPGQGYYYSDQYLARSLQELHLRGCFRLTDYALGYVVRFTALQKLTLDDCQGFTTHGISGLKNLKNLSFLCLRTSPRVSGEQLRQCLNSSVVVSNV